MSERLVDNLRRLNLDARTSAEAKNVGRGWIGIDCPVCADTGKHLSVNVKSLRCACWRCDLRGHLFSILQEHFNVTWGTIKQTFKARGIAIDRDQTLSLQVQRILEGAPLKPEAEQTVIKRPPHARAITRDTDMPMLDNFLARRFYTRKDCIEAGALVASFGMFAGRLIVPIYHDGQIVAYQGRTMVENGVPKYYADGITGNYFYGLDECDLNKPVALVEGVFDKWRLGPQALCSFGKTLSSAQKRILAEVQPQYLYLVWDADAFWSARSIRGELAAYGINVKHIELPEGEDPDSLGTQHTLRLIWENRFGKERVK